MSENKVAEGDSPSESTEAIGVDPSQATDVDGLAGQLERLLTPEPEPAPAAEESVENAESEESPPEGSSSDEQPEEGEAEEVLSQTESEDSAEVEPAADESADSPSPQKGLLKRIDKLTAKRRVAEGRVDDLESEVKSLREQLESKEELPELANVPSANPYSNLTSQRAVEKEMEKADEILEWCEDNPDGAIVEKGGDDDVEYSADDVRNIKRNARKSIKKHLPERLDYLREESQVNDQVDKVFTYWKDRSSVGYQEAQDILKNRPEIRTHPTWKADVSIFQLGLQAYREMVNNPKSNLSKPKAKAPAQPSTPTSAPTQAKPAAARSASARKSFDSSRDEDSLANVILNDYL
mgnify:CR=1 FL=1|tara:strand:+ start:266 stop:1321 length:1056 start_codon:yes stop_codon:yes gene_type:complete